MKRCFAIIPLTLSIALGAKATFPALDSVYFYYAEQEYPKAEMLLNHLGTHNLSPEEKFLLQLEIADFQLDKTRNYARAESLYQDLVNRYPRHRLLPDVLYRLGLTQELQEKFLDAARNYEQVATKYFKSTYGQEALDAIERCFRKNYQERVAYVNGYPITRIELDDRISRNPTLYDSFDKKLALLDTMINNRLLFEAARASGMENDPQIIQSLNDIRNRMVFQTWYERHVIGRAEPSEKELRVNYRKNISRYTSPERIRVFQLVVTSKSLADSLYRVLTADTSRWDSLVKLHSITPDKEKGGDLGLFTRGVHPRPIEDVAFRMKPGEISKPVALRDTYYILKVTEKQPRTIKKFDEVKNQVAVELRQERTNDLYEQEINRLKKAANIVQDSQAIEQGRETLALVNGIPITREHLEARLNAIPPFFRGQFETPEGKRRILDQLIIEKLLLRECEREKLWLANRVVDQLLNRRTALLIDAYRRSQTTEKITLDSATLFKEYRATINDFKEPTRVRCREMVARTREKAEQLRSWAVAGRIPALISGIAFLVPDENRAHELANTLRQTTDTDSLAAPGSLAGFNVRIPGIPVYNIRGRDLVDITLPTKLAGPFSASDFYSFVFNDLSSADRLYEPVPVSISEPEQLKLLVQKEGLAIPLENIDSTRLGPYARIANPLPGSFVKNLFTLEAGGVSEPYKTAGGYLVVKITRKDTAQKIEFVDLIRRFSTSGSKWAGGELALTRDDKARDKRVVDLAYSLSKGAYSPVVKLNDTTYTFIRMEEKKPAYTRPFSEVRTKIENKLRRQQEKELYDRLLKELRSKAQIEILMKEEDFQTGEPENAPEQPEKR